MDHDKHLALDELDFSIDAHALRRLNAIRKAKLGSKEASARIAETMTERDNARGRMIRKFIDNNLQD